MTVNEMNTVLEIVIRDCGYEPMTSAYQEVVTINYRCDDLVHVEITSDIQNNLTDTQFTVTISPRVMIYIGDSRIESTEKAIEMMSELAKANRFMEKVQKMNLVATVFEQNV